MKAEQYVINVLVWNTLAFGLCFVYHSTSKIGYSVGRERLSSTKATRDNLPLADIQHLIRCMNQTLEHKI
jgi:hypothetical protein